MIEKGSLVLYAGFVVLFVSTRLGHFLMDIACVMTMGHGALEVGYLAFVYFSVSHGCRLSSMMVAGDEGIVNIIINIFGNIILNCSTYAVGMSSATW